MLSRTVNKISRSIRPNIATGLLKLNPQNGKRNLNLASEPQLQSWPPTGTKEPLKAASKLQTSHSKSNKSILPSTLTPEANPTILSQSIKELLPLLATQPSHYITVHIHGRPYLVTAGDTVRLPFKIPGVVPGDVLRLNRAANIGSRDYTLKGAPYIDERLFECRATVMGTESEPMRIKEKKKRRNRRVKTVKSKHRYTILRIADLRVKNLQEINTQSTE